MAKQTAAVLWCRRRPSKRSQALTPQRHPVGGQACHRALCQQGLVGGLHAASSLGGQCGCQTVSCMGRRCKHTLQAVRCIARGHAERSRHASTVCGKTAACIAGLSKAVSNGGANGRRASGHLLPWQQCAVHCRFSASLYSCWVQAKLILLAAFLRSDGSKFGSGLRNTTSKPDMTNAAQGQLPLASAPLGSPSSSPCIPAVPSGACPPEPAPSSPPKLQPSRLGAACCASARASSHTAEVRGSPAGPWPA